MIDVVLQRQGFPLVTTQEQPLKIATPAVMEHVRRTIKDTVTPSWVRSVPYNFGDATAGHLKADEWRTLFTVYLPLALIGLWGEGTSHASPDEATQLRRVLDHTMALVSAVILACKRTMTAERAHAYRAYIKTWVGELQQIHPEAVQRPNNHMAFHIYEFIQLFGPVRSWWCFPFERLIGQLQQLPMNHKFGELHVSCHPICMLTFTQENLRDLC
jgi:hypothetical protein